MCVCLCIEGNCRNGIPFAICLSKGLSPTWSIFRVNKCPHLPFCPHLPSCPGVFLWTALTSGFPQ